MARASGEKPHGEEEVSPAVSPGLGARPQLVVLWDPWGDRGQGRAETLPRGAQVLHLPRRQLVPFPSRGASR